MGDRKKRKIVCRFCGYHMDANRKRCPFCGSYVDPNPVTAEDLSLRKKRKGEEIPGVIYITERDRGSAHKIIKVILTVLIIAGIIAGGFFAGRKLYQKFIEKEQTAAVIVSESGQAVGTAVQKTEI